MQVFQLYPTRDIPATDHLRYLETVTRLGMDAESHARPLDWELIQKCIDLWISSGSRYGLYSKSYINSLWCYFRLGRKSGIDATGITFALQFIQHRQYSRSTAAHFVHSFVGILTANGFLLPHQHDTLKKKYPLMRRKLSDCMAFPLPQLPRLIRHLLERNSTKRITNVYVEAVDREIPVHLLRDVVIVMCLAMTGLRITELLDVKLSDVEMIDTAYGEALKLSVCRLKKRDTEAAVDTTYVTLSQQLLGMAVRPYVLSYYEYLVRIGCEYLFPPTAVLAGATAISKRIDASLIQKLLAEAGRYLDIEHCHAHAFRHMFADLIREQFDSAWVQRALGHRSADTTSMYGNRNLLPTLAALKFQPESSRSQGNTGETEMSVEEKIQGSGS